MNDSVDIEKVQKLLGVSFKDTSLLAHSLIHASLDRQIPHNRRQAYLALVGDGVFYLATLEYLNEYFPGKSLEWISTRRQLLVKNVSLSNFFHWSGLDAHVLKDKNCVFGRIGSGTVMEAIVGAVMIDQGYDVARRLIFSILQSHEAKLVVKKRQGRSDIPKLERDPRNAPSDLRG